MSEIRLATKIARRGAALRGLETGALVNVKASRADLTGALAVAEETVTKPAAVSGNAGTLVSPDTASQASWPARGGPCNSDRSWCNLVYELDGEFCTDTCELTDKLAARLTVTPSVSGRNSVSWTVVYLPDSNNFAGYHFEWFVLKFAAETVCGSGNTGSFSTSQSKSFTTSCDSVLYNSHNMTAVEFWAFFTPIDDYVFDQARDGGALCQPESSDNNYCLY